MSTSATRVDIVELPLVIYGQVQYEFAVNGQAGFDLASAMVTCTSQRGAAVDAEVNTVANQVRQRVKKTEDVGQGLSYAAELVAEGVNQSTKAQDKIGDRKVNGVVDVGYVDRTIGNIWNWVKGYDLTFTDADNKTKSITTLWEFKDGKYTITMTNAQKLQGALQTALDSESTELKKSTNTLNSFVTKRDNAYQLVGKVQQKLDKTAGNTIHTIGN